MRMVKFFHLQESLPGITLGPVKKILTCLKTPLYVLGIVNIRVLTCCSEKLFSLFAIISGDDRKE